MANQPDPTHRLRLLGGQGGTSRAGDRQQPNRGAHRAARDADPAERLTAPWAAIASELPAGDIDAAAGWVPDWAADPDGDDETFVGDDTSVGDGTSVGDETSVSDETSDEDAVPTEPYLADDLDALGDHQLPPLPRQRLPRPRWNRLRDRWVPEPLREVRLDPGRKGSILLSLIAATAAVIAAIGVWSGTPGPQPMQQVSVNTPTVDRATTTPTVGATVAAPTTIVVAVTGFVRNPGVVTLAAGSRVADAVAAAGGMLDGVDYTGLNLAAKLADGDSVVVGGMTQGLQSASVTAVQPGSAATLINLNTADQTTLETLPGVGPVMASNIFAWRTANGPFTTVDQLQEITGIGPARFATLAPLVTI